MGILGLSSVRGITKTHHFFAHLKYMFILTPTTVFVTKALLFFFFLQRTKKAFCLQLQDSNKKNNKKGGKEAIMCIWRACTCSIFTYEPKLLFPYILPSNFSLVTLGITQIFLSSSATKISE